MYTALHVRSQRPICVRDTFHEANSAAVDWADDLAAEVYDQEGSAEDTKRMNYFGRLCSEVAIVENYIAGSVQALDVNRARFGEVEGYDENHA